MAACQYGKIGCDNIYSYLKLFPMNYQYRACFPKTLKHKFDLLWDSGLSDADSPGWAPNSLLCNNILGPSGDGRSGVRMYKAGRRLGSARFGSAFEIMLQYCKRAEGEYTVCRQETLQEAT